MNYRNRRYRLDSQIFNCMAIKKGVELSLLMTAADVVDVLDEKTIYQFNDVASLTEKVFMIGDLMTLIIRYDEERKEEVMVIFSKNTLTQPKEVTLDRINDEILMTLMDNL